MIKHDGKTIVARSHGGADLCKKYHGDKLVWVKNIERRLPMEYQEVEYLQADGRQYINLNLLPSVEHSFTTKVKITDKNIANNMIIGSRTSGTFQTSDDQIYMNWQKVDKRIVLRNRYMANVIYFDEGVDGFFDLRSVQNKNCQLTTVSQPYFLFALNKLGTPDAFASCQMYNFIIRSDDGVVVNLVPCYRKSDHKSGMYDTITNKFFTSETSTDFFVGANVKCKKLEYCENLNGNYIDLRMKLKSSYKTKVDFQVPQTTTENRGVIFGTRGTNTDTIEYSLDKAYMLANWTRTATTFITADVWNVYQGDGAKRRYSVSEADRYKRLLVEISDTVIKVNGATVKTNTTLTEFETVKSACIFGNPLVSLATTQLLIEYVNAKIYSVEIKDKTDNLLFSLIPYQIGDTVGMLDTLSKVFFSGELVGKPFGTKQSRSR